MDYLRLLVLSDCMIFQTEMSLFLTVNLFFFPLRYEDEINKRTECENDFVLIKKVSITDYAQLVFELQFLFP